MEPCSSFRYTALPKFSNGSFGVFPAQEWGCFYIRAQNLAGFVFGGYVVVDCCGSVGGSVKENQEKDLVTALLKPNPVL